MKTFIKPIRILALVCLIVLAGFGIGLSGGIPLSSANKRKDAMEVNNELVPCEEGETGLSRQEIKP